MATIGFKGIYAATYSESGSTVSYTGCASMGKPIDCNMELKAAEGRLYAADALDKYRRKITGGSISIVAEDIPDTMRKLIFGEEDSARTVGSATSVAGLKITDSTVAPYVGIAGYAPEDVNGEDKFHAFFAPKALFASPSMHYKTMDTAIEFQVPTCVGEFMKAADGEIFEHAILDTEEDAIAWCKLVLGGSGVAAAAVKSTAPLKAAPKSGGSK